MKITCSKNNLVVAVNIVSRAVPAKTTMNILECILIEASNGIIKLTSNNTEMGIETKVAGQIEENGVVAIDAKIFGDIVRRLPESDIHIETDPETLMTTIKADRAKFNLRGKSGDDFTPLPIFIGLIQNLIPVCRAVISDITEWHIVLRLGLVFKADICDADFILFPVFGQVALLIPYLLRLRQI